MTFGLKDTNKIAGSTTFSANRGNRFHIFLKQPSGDSSVLVWQKALKSFDLLFNSANCNIRRIEILQKPTEPINANTIIEKETSGIGNEMLLGNGFNIGNTSNLRTILSTYLVKNLKDDEWNYFTSHLNEFRVKIKLGHRTNVSTIDEYVFDADSTTIANITKTVKPDGPNEINFTITWNSTNQTVFINSDNAANSVIRGVEIIGRS